MILTLFPLYVRRAGASVLLETVLKVPGVEVAVRVKEGKALGPWKPAARHRFAHGEETKQGFSGD